MSNSSVKKLINSLNVPLKKDNIKKRSMHKSVNKAINMQLIREINNSSKMQTRGMACVHSGRLKPKAPKPKVTDTDVSNILIFYMSFDESKVKPTDSHCHSQFQLANDTGNPWVRTSLPGPRPDCTRTAGCGSLRSQVFCWVSIGLRVWVWVPVLEG